jgi:membrane associated rhomboid family serine protease
MDANPPAPTEPDPAGPDVASGLPDPRVPGPLDRATALTFLGIGDRLLERGETEAAGGYYQRVVGFDDPAVTAAALMGLGNVLYRLDREGEALGTWRSVVALGETPSAYPAWRQIAAALVRDGDLAGAAAAYREADRRAPADDKAEIASRLGWLAKESGDQRAARRYFARSRGGGGLPIPLTYLIIGLTVIVSLTTFANGPQADDILAFLWLDKILVASGQWYRLLSVTLVHGSVLHLLFNMYALYLVGPIVERIYGWKTFGLMYLLCALAGSVGSMLVGDPAVPSVGASGAIFGLFGVVLAATRIHDPILDRRGRALVGQIGMLIVLNLVFGFANPGIDNAAHVGGLLAGLWLGFVLVPGNVRTLRGSWQLPGGTAAGAIATEADRRLVRLVRLMAVVVLLLAIGAGLTFASGRIRTDGRGPGQVSFSAGVRPAAAQRSAGGGSGEGSGVIGRSTLRRAPRGATFSASASPPWARASSRTIASPSPRPGPARLGSPR